MPIYEYVCQECAHPFEELVFGRDEVPPCPKCKAARVEKVLSCFAVGGQGESMDAMCGAGPCGAGACGNPRGPGGCGMN
jgi:putative FmdB family regulatory protein